MWPDAGARDALAAAAEALRRACGGRAPPARNLHLTLAFLGDVPAAQLPDLMDIAGGLAAASFELTLDRVGYWRQHRLVWVGPQNCPAALQALAAELADALQARGFDIERRRFLPHLTLLRDARRAPATTELGPISWHVQQFALVCSRPAVPGVHYDMVSDWPLAGAPARL